MSKNRAFPKFFVKNNRKKIWRFKKQKAVKIKTFQSNFVDNIFPYWIILRPLRRYFTWLLDFSCKNCRWRQHFNSNEQDWSYRSCINQVVDEVTVARLSHSVLRMHVLLINQVVDKVPVTALVTVLATSYRLLKPVAIDSD